VPRDCNIFYNVFTDENSTTEILCNMFQFSCFRDLFIREIHRNFANDLSPVEVDDLNFKYENIDEHQSIKGEEELGRPDIVVKTETMVLLIENKINDAELTEPQRKLYRDYLNKYSKKRDGNIKRVIVFLIPSDYKHMRELDSIIERKPNYLYAKKLYWDQLSDILRESGIPEVNIVFSHFNSIIDDKLRTHPISLEGKDVEMMYNKEVAKSIRELLSVVNEIRRKTEHKTSKNITEDEYGMYVKDDKNEETVWLGVYYKFWVDYERPLWLGIVSSKINRISSKTKRKLFNVFEKEYVKREEGWDHFPLSKEYFEAHLGKAGKSLINDITDLIDSIVDELSAVGRRRKL